MTEHKYLECTCGEDGCIFCDGDLASCTICEGTEGSLTTECCGRKITEDEGYRIYKLGTLDFKGGKWVNTPNPCNQTLTRSCERHHTFKEQS